jgi:hypothetical protein
MIKLSKKTAFILMVIMSLGLMFSLISVKWENINENLIKELKLPFLSLLLTIYYIIYYVRILKEENKLK